MNVEKRVVEANFEGAKTVKKKRRFANRGRGRRKARARAFDRRFRRARDAAA